MRIGKVIGVWAMLAALMVCNGALREVILEPLLGTEAGEMMSAFIGIIIIFGASRPFLISEPEQPLPRVARISAIWLALTVAFEVSVGLLGGNSWSTIGQAYAVWDGSFWPVVLVAVGTAPFMWLRRPNHPYISVTK